MVEPDLAEFVDQHRGVRQRRVAQQALQQRRLARAEASGDQFGIEWIARLACQPLGGGPEVTEIIDDLALAGCAREDKRGSLPIGHTYTVIFQNPVRRRHLTCPLASARRCIGVAREDTRSDDGGGPVLSAA